MIRTALVISFFHSDTSQGVLACQRIYIISALFGNFPHVLFDKMMSFHSVGNCVCEVRAGTISS